ncbi:MAG: O-antigen ligase family protein [Chthoniobacter sp.]
MDWGLGNPNKTAALIAILMVSVWCIAYAFKRGFWIALLLFTGLGVCLVHTFSRGGVVAVCFGSVILLWQAPRPWLRSRVIGLLIAAWLIVGVSVWLEADKRLVQGAVQEDKSITNRLSLWRAAPRMILDSPNGWGIGNAGLAYGEWYQPVNSAEEYRTLVNSHLTWLVEFGWPARVLYVFGWFSVLALCWPGARYRWMAVSFSIWCTFAVAAFFSSVAESPWLWVVPGISAIAAIFARLAMNARQALVILPFPLAGTIGVFAAIGIIGVSQNSLPLHTDGQAVVIGNGEPAVCVFSSPSVFGNRAGRTLRECWTAPINSGGIAVLPLRLIDNYPLAGKTIVLGGVLPRQDCAKMNALTVNCKKVILLNPVFSPQDIGVSQAAVEKMQVLFGEFSQSPSAGAWQSFIGKPAPRIEGVGDFLPEWPRLLSSSL